MATRQELIHIHSAVKDKVPSASSIKAGEIAVNYNSNNPFLSFKDSANNVVKVSTDNWVNENFATLDDLDEVALTTSASLTSLDKRLTEHGHGTIWGKALNGTTGISGDMSSVGNITPSGNSTYEIGSSSKKFKKINLSESANIGGSSISYNATTGCLEIIA